MGCPCETSAASTGNYQAAVLPQYQNVGNEGCSITSLMLQTWKAALTCVKAQGSWNLIGLSLASINQILGVLQSAINYPDNYCFYYPQLQQFQGAVLPQIITNVPICIS